MKHLFTVCLIMAILIITGGCTLKSNSTNQKIKSDTIKNVVAGLIEDAKTDEEKIKRIYYFVRDEIEFGWVYPQEIPPEEVLRNKRGVCMQKANLLVAMAREAGLRARFHFMYVRKNALEDFLPGFAYSKWIDPFPHTFPEIYLNKKWVPMEATIDRELHKICLKKKINIGRYDNMAKNVSIEFSVNGVKGHQQYWRADRKDSFYGDDLSEFTKFLHKGVPWWKRLLQPMIFRKAQKIMDEHRGRK